MVNVVSTKAQNRLWRLALSFTSMRLQIIMNKRLLELKKDPAAMRAFLKESRRKHMEDPYVRKKVEAAEESIRKVGLPKINRKK